MPYPYTMDENNTAFWKSQEMEQLRKESFRAYTALMAAAAQVQRLALTPEMPSGVDIDIQFLAGKVEYLAIELSGTLPGMVEAENETTQGW